jgi:hypothetical protein
LKAGFRRHAGWHYRNPLLAKRVLRLQKGSTLVDLLLVSDTHERNAMKRRRLHRAAKFRFYIIAPEDLVMMKLKAGRPRDWEDLVGVLRRQRGKID